MYDPAPHVWHSADEAAAGLKEYEPRVQFMHVPLLDAPMAVEYVPAEQLLHAVDPDGENEPAPHVTHTEDDCAAITVEKEPERQLTHDALLGACSVVEYAPAEQAEHVVANDDAKVPATQTTHDADDAAP